MRVGRGEGKPSPCVRRSIHRVSRRSDIQPADDAVGAQSGDVGVPVFLEADGDIVGQIRVCEQSAAVASPACGLRHPGSMAPVEIAGDLGRVVPDPVRAIARFVVQAIHQGSGARASSNEAFSSVPAHTRQSAAGRVRTRCRARIDRLPNEAMYTASALPQASRARVPLVVVMMISRPSTRLRVNSRGELPRSKSGPPVWRARMRNPSRSPANNASGWHCLRATASAISRVGRIAVAPCPRASSIVDVALRTSNTTQVTP